VSQHHDLKITLTATPDEQPTSQHISRYSNDTITTTV
jgi:hypothetical protein